jgi:hypothetical protein
MTALKELTTKLVEFDDTQLFLQLGMSSQAISEDLEEQTRSSSINSIEPVFYEITRSNSDTLNFGQRLFKRLNAASYELLCKDPFDNGETLKKLGEALKESTATATGLLAPILVANLGLAPAVAAIVATLIVKTLSKSIADEICSTWKNNPETN